MPSGDWSQTNRLIQLATPLGPDVLHVTELSGHEQVSRLFHFELRLVSQKSDIDPKEIVGKVVKLKIAQYDGSSFREINGRVSRFMRLPSGGDVFVYRAEIVPSLWFLSQATDCRIFQEMSIPEVLDQVLNDFGVTDFDRSGVRGSTDKWEYCVQYRETALNFFMRLCEQEGIFFWFKHEGGKDVLMLADHKSAYQNCPIKHKFPAVGPNSKRSEVDVVSGWERTFQFRPGKWAQRDYNFEDPSNNLETKENSVLGLDRMDQFEIYDYPGEYEVSGGGQTLTRLRIEEEEAQYDVAHGESGCRSMLPGYKIELKFKFSPSEDGEYLLTSVTHSARQPTPGSNANRGASEYTNTFSCIPASVQFRPIRRTPKPIVQGPQTAVVVGPPGEEIYTDKYGRVKVQFFWDRRGQFNESSSCWIRVSQLWAGKNWGAIANPRIGQEVIVEHLEGDPDRPIITGRVYNAEQMPPYELPGNQTQTGMKSRSSKGGGPADFNEFRFEDKKGSEQIYLHAQKNLDSKVENCETRVVDVNRTTTIGKDETTTVKGKRTETIHKDETLTIKEGNRKETLEMGNEDLEIKMGNRKEKISMGNDELEVSLGGITHKCPIGTYKIEAMKVDVTATAMIELKCGASKISMNPGMIIIQAPLVKIN